MSSDQSHWISCVGFNFCAHFVNNIIRYHRVFYAQFHLIEIYNIVRLVPHTQSMTSMWDMFIDADFLFHSLTNDWVNTVAIPLPNYTLKQSRNTFFLRLQSVLRAFVLALKHVCMRSRSIKSFVLICFVFIFMRSAFSLFVLEREREREKSLTSYST